MKYRNFFILFFITVSTCHIHKINNVQYKVTYMKKLEQCETKNKTVMTSYFTYDFKTCIFDEDSITDFRIINTTFLVFTSTFFMKKSNKKIVKDLSN